MGGTAAGLRGRHKTPGRDCETVKGGNGSLSVSEDDLTRRGSRKQLAQGKVMQLGED